MSKKNISDKKKSEKKQPEKEMQQTEKELKEEKSTKEDDAAENQENEKADEDSDELKSEETEKQNAEGEDSWKKKYEEMNDKYLRLTAEYDNYRKRSLKERMDLIKTAGDDILKSILPVVDNIERAQKSIDEAKEIEPIKEGIRLISKTFTDFLEQRGVKEIEAVGKEFDTDLHEALTKVPAPEEKLKGKVVDVVEKGYLLHDKVIRYAKVVIGE